MITISIITVAFNSEKTIRDTLASVSKQTYPNIEHIIVDGASKDNTMDIVRQFPHIKKAISEPDYSIYDAMNKGIQMATGDVIGFLNSDDIYADNHVLERVARLFELKSIDSLYGDLQFFENNPDNIVRTWNSGVATRRRFLYGWMPPHPTFFVKKCVYQRFGNFDISFKFAADYELMLRYLYRHGISTHYMQGTSIKMRVGGLSNASLMNRWLANREDVLAWHKNALKPYAFTVWLKPIMKLEQFKMIYRKFRIFRQAYIEPTFEPTLDIADIAHAQNVELELA
jgi:glycosyltransferase involved in cell wall biosynthesis